MTRKSGHISSTTDTKNMYKILVRQNEKIHNSWKYYQESENNIKNIPRKFVYWRMKGFDTDQNRDQQGSI
jgi:hypothetical protein